MNKRNQDDRSVISLWSIDIMASSSVQLFQFVQKIYHIICIEPLQSNQRQCSIVSKRNFFVFFAGQMSVTSFIFLIFEAKSMFDYVLAYMAFITANNGIVIYLLFIWQLKNSFKFIGNCEGFIKKS